MTPEPLVASIMQYGPWLVFGNVLLQQLGLPVPVWPTLLVVGSLAAGWPQLALALVAAVGAAMVADRFWYWLGRRYGYKVLALLCRLSLNPGSCVTQTEQRFGRWGAPALLVAKFVPGFSAVAAPVAGLSRMPVARFTLAAASGAALWAGAGLLTGWLLRGEVGQALAWMRTHGPLALRATRGAGRAMPPSSPCVPAPRTPLPSVPRTRCGAWALPRCVRCAAATTPGARPRRCRWRARMRWRRKPHRRETMRTRTASTVWERAARDQALVATNRLIAGKPAPTTGSQAS